MEELSEDQLAKDAVLVENNAQTIYDHLNDLEKDSKVYSKRWFWELLQNAKDSVSNNQKVAIKVELESNKLTFSHTGEPFQQDDVLHLIFHGSSKKSLQGKTGRFGTGFMTTHLLSRKVIITGKLVDGRYFKFKLNRDANDVADQKRNLDISYENFLESRSATSYSPAPFETTFTYELTEKGIKIAKDGIAQLQKIMPFVMAFNETIDTIDVKNELNAFCVAKGESSEYVYEDYKLIDQDIICDGETTSIIIIKTAESDTAVIVDKREATPKVIELDETYPKLFFDFPLFGTEKLGCPLVINSKKYDLKAERDGVYLDSENLPVIIENKKIVSNSISQITKIIKYLLEEDVSQLFNLFKFKAPFEYSWLDSEWLRVEYQDQIELLLEADCCRNERKILKLNKIKIPHSYNVSFAPFFQLVKEYYPLSTAPQSEIYAWVEVANGFSVIEAKEIFEYDFIINEHKLCKIIECKLSLVDLNKRLDPLVIDGKSVDKAVIWLNKFLDLQTKEQLDYLTAQYQIIPNQKKNFVKKDVYGPFLDLIDDEKIKTVAENFSWEIKSELIYQEIEVKSGVFQSLTLEKVITHLNLHSDKITDEQLSTEQNRTALISYLKWVIDKNKNSLLKDIHVVVEKGREASILTYSKRRLFQSNSDKLIAPSDIWVDQLSIYKDIVQRKLILIDEYSEIISDGHFQTLEDLDLIFLKPLIIKNTPSKNDLKLLVQGEDYPKLLNEKDEIVENNIEYSDIAYLTRSDENILARTGDSMKSAKALLKFVLSQVITVDQHFNTFETIEIGDDKIQLNKCLWVARLRDTQWVPLKSTETDKQGNSERPSVSNITELIKDDVEIVEFIKTKKAAIFFNQLGISVADLLRNTLKSEELKLQWDMTFSQLIINNKVDPELALEMLSDPLLQEVYREQKTRREQIQRNQKVGYLFEEIFNEIFKSEEFKQQGIFIKRTGIGSDYGVIYDEDIIDENNREVIFEIGQVLIELKATGKNIAEMTTTQAETASSNADHYVLAVLPLVNCSDGVHRESVLKHTRFITNIGDKVTENFKGFLSYKNKLNEVIEAKNGIKLNIEDGKIRYQISSSVWETDQLSIEPQPQNFTQFTNWLKTNNK